MFYDLDETTNNVDDYSYDVFSMIDHVKSESYYSWFFQNLATR